MTTIPQNLSAITIEATFLFPGPAGDLEVLISPAPENCVGIGFICHPHPLYGGTMHNKVVTTLAKAFTEARIQAIRFNFRGIGQSAGSFANGEGETDDLLALVSWVKKLSPHSKLWLAGFSFGGFVAISAATQVPFDGLITIAPAVTNFGFTTPPKITCPWILVQGEEDDVVPAAQVYAWVDTLEVKPEVISMPGAGHFFHGKLGELKRELLILLVS